MFQPSHSRPAVEWPGCRDERAAERWITGHAFPAAQRIQSVKQKRLIVIDLHIGAKTWPEFGAGANRKSPVKETINAKKEAPAKAQQAVALAEYAAKALVAAEHLRIKTKAVKQFPLDQDERATVADLPALAVKVKKKLAMKGSSSP